jgi:nucleoside-diphosphate-sugar epimerase
VSVRRVLVTGASGFIGGHLARALRSEGARGASRAASADGTIAWCPPFDPADPASAERALRGVDVLVHAAGRAHVLRERAPDPLAAFREANVRPTEVLVAAARRTGVRRIVLLSTVAVHGDDVPGLVRADTPVAPTSHYGTSRAEAEDVVRGAATDIEGVILRLPLVYGPGMKGNPLRLFDLVWRGVPIPLGAIRNRRSPLGVGTLVRVVRRTLDLAAGLAGTHLVADPDPVSTPTLVREIGAALGRPARLLPLPMPLLRAAAAVGPRVLGARFPLDGEALHRLAGDLVLEVSWGAGPLFGGVEPVPRTEELAAAAAWYRTQVRARAAG